MSNSDIYFKELLINLSATDNLNFKAKNEFWKSKYADYLDGILTKSLEQLPQIITLIHPDFLIDGDGNNIGYLINHDRSNFNDSVSDSDLCQIASIDNELECQFNEYRNIRQKCHADHYWPFSLGGPTILENRVLLCRFHNLAKSNSIVNHFWGEYPSWLNNYLNRIFNLKQ